MCGIMGYTGTRQTIDVLLKGLKRLEYRGYDSAGIAYFRAGKIEMQKSEGKLQQIEKLFANLKPFQSHCGIGHTRWATHGKPTTQNAHPHRTGQILLVHNGIIENYQEIKEHLIQKGHLPLSETDSELFGFLVLEELEAGRSFLEAVRHAFMKLEGACSVVVLSEDDPDTLIGIRNGSPLVAARDPNGGSFIASDAQPIIEYTKEVFFLENGDIVVAKGDMLSFFDLKTGAPIDRKSSTLDWDADKLDKQGFPHYMLKEIYEEPRTLIDTLNSVVDRAHTDPFPLAEQPGVDLLKSSEELILVACGSSWHAALEGKYWLERWAGIPVAVECASEYRYRDPVLRRNSLVVGISQSGETADTLAVIREMRARGIPTLAITNVRGSTLSRESNATFYTASGPEIGVASTKTFISQLAILFLWAGYLGLSRGRDTAEKVPAVFDQLIRLPHAMEIALQDSEGGLRPIIQAVAKKVVNHRGFFFIGRGYSYPIALEGALKLKEIAYIHAEGYAAGELKHGPIAMIDEDLCIVVLAPKDSWYEKTFSNLQEVKARGGTIVGVGDAGDVKFKNECDAWIPLPSHGPLDESLHPFLTSLVVHLLSYEIAVLKETDIDQPRNLAKSVTVE